MTAPLLHGGCLCGAVRYTLAGPPGPAEYCHCGMCRKAHGSAFSANAAVPSEALRIVQGADATREYASSANRRKVFCATCGTQLFIRRTNDPGRTVVTLGSLDDDAAIPAPARHVFVDSKAPWHAIDAALPRWRVYPGFEPEGG
jgi:hypothetical protein